MSRQVVSIWACSFPVELSGAIVCLVDRRVIDHEPLPCVVANDDLLASVVPYATCGRWHARNGLYARGSCAAWKC
jgi:hypothetical protein